MTGSGDAAVGGVRGVHREDGGDAPALVLVSCGRSLLQLVRRAERLVHDPSELLHLVVEQQVLPRDGAVSGRGGQRQRRRWTGTWPDVT